MGTIVLTRPENAKSAVKLGYPVCMERTGIPRGSTVIRWGNGLDPDTAGWAQVLNKASVMQISTDKPAALAALARVVATPKLYHQGDLLPRGARYVGRPASHAEGSDFNLIDLRGATRGVSVTDDHATEYIEDTNEYRVWFVRNKYLLSRRVPLAAEGQSEDDTCRSKWGYQAIAEMFPKLKEEVTKARQAIPLDFGAIDVLWKEGDGTVAHSVGKWYFLEFNSAPSLDTDRVLSFFKRELKAILGPETPSEVVQAVPARENAANRSVARPEAIVRPVAGPSWEQKYRAELLASKKARELEIQREVFGE